jgi:hypothetical protein
MSHRYRDTRTELVRLSRPPAQQHDLNKRPHTTIKRLVACLDGSSPAFHSFRVKLTTCRHLVEFGQWHVQWQAPNRKQRHKDCSSTQSRKSGWHPADSLLWQGSRFDWRLFGSSCDGYSSLFLQRHWWLTESRCRR